MSTEYRTVTYNGLSNLKIRHTALIQEETQITCTKKAGFYQVHIEKSIDMHVWYENLQQMQELSFLKNNKASKKNHMFKMKIITN